MAARWVLRLFTATRRLVFPDKSERDLRDDVEGNVQMLADEHIAAGLSPVEARRRALVEFGGVESVKESVREIRTGVLFEQTLQDLGYALRGLHRTPTFTLTVVMTLGLGLGVNTTVFSIINTALLKPVPYDRPEELVEVGHRTGKGLNEMISHGVSWAEGEHWRAATNVFAGVEKSRRANDMTWREHDEVLHVGAMTSGLPSLLGIAPQAGRMFTRDEADRQDTVLVISDAFWARAFGRAAGVVGATMTLENRAMTIIGVMPPTFRYMTGAGDSRLDAWTGLRERGSIGGTSGIFRLRPGLSIDRALPLAVETAARIQADDPPKEPWTPVLFPFAPERGLQAGFRQQPILFLSFAIAGIVLLVACANITNLLAARGDGRRQELAVRAALGATRGRLSRLLLCEGAVLAGLGGLLALVLAKWTAGAVVELMPSRMSAQFFRVGLPDIDWRVFAFASSATCLVALLSALWPALRGSTIGRFSTLIAGGKVAGVSRDRRRVSFALQAAQIALAMVLATTSALFATSLSRMLSTDLGFDPEGLAYAEVQLPAGFAKSGARNGVLDRLLERVRATPGVQHASIGNSPAITHIGRFVRSGDPELPANRANLKVRYASPGYFETAGIRLVAGRDFTAADTMTSPPVAIIDETGARAAFPGESPLGQTFSSGFGAPSKTIVGVVSSVAGPDFAKPTRTVSMYYAASQDTSVYATFLVRTT
ncbi:MAG: ABC transporter permease, partial [Vicinamibacterales bacterium]